MALKIYVEDEVHERLRVINDDANNTFLNVCRRRSIAGTKVMDIIDPYTDTMLNFIQLDRLIDELADVLDEVLELHERMVVGEVRQAATEARQISGYLFIVGD